MSKAFTKETETELDDELPEDDVPALPEGVKNYITPEGFKRLQDEVKRLLDVDRPKVVEIVHWAAGNGDRSENGDYIYGKRRLREIDRRIRFLTKRLERAEMVDPARQKNHEQIFFGATVTFHNLDTEAKHTVTIVGVDEIDATRGRISWVSPVAKALLKAREGDIVQVRTPHGAEQLEVIAIKY